MSDVQFVNGIRIFKPNTGAPDYVKGNMKINKRELLAWLTDQPDEIKIVMKESKLGKYYLSVDNWQPSQQDQQPAPNGAGQMVSESLRKAREEAANANKSTTETNDDLPF